MAEPCHCEASTARDGHFHEPDGSVLCLHWHNDDTDEYEDGSECPEGLRVGRVIASL